jgi:phage gpG-like protein
VDNDDTTTINTKGLDQIIKALKHIPQIRVGILGAGARSGSELDNATLGAFHEFGTTTMPRRSFLKEPITDNLDKRLQESGALDKNTFKEVIKTGKLLDFAMKVAAIAEGIVVEAFHTNGFGKWKSWSGSYRSKTGNILVDTTQLKNSITSEVK